MSISHSKVGRLVRLSDSWQVGCLAKMSIGIYRPHDPVLTLLLFYVSLIGKVSDLL